MDQVFVKASEAVKRMLSVALDFAVQQEIAAAQRFTPTGRAD